MSLIVLIVLLSIFVPVVYNIKYKVKDLTIVERLDSTLDADARCITALQYKEKEELENTLVTQLLTKKLM